MPRMDIVNYNSPYKGIGENPAQRERIKVNSEDNAWYDDAADAIGEKFSEDNIDEFLKLFEQEYTKKEDTP